MKSLQRSYGKIFPLALICLFSSLVGSLAGCESTETRPDQAQTDIQKTGEVSVETSLENDKKTIEELRKNIPAEKRQENDQLKEILSLMGEVKDPPARIRERFNRVTQRMRRDERAANQRERESFNRDEKKNRDEFYRNLKSKREEFNSQKNDREARKRFYDEQDRVRKEFTADDRDKRNQFNADNKVKSDDFNTMLREKNNEFSQELRAYTQRYNEHQKALKEKKKLSTQLPASHITPLKTGDSGP